MKKNPVIHFEVPYEDAKRVSSFYSTVFGWDMQMTSPDMGNYILAETTDVDENMMPKTPGSINGGFFEKSNQTGNSPLITIAVDDIKESMKKVTEEGGKILGEPVNIPNVGDYVAFVDTEGNRGSILQPSR